MSHKLTFEVFEALCRPEAELLEEELHYYSKREQEWGLVFDLTARPLIKWVDGEGFYIGIVVPVGDRGWGLPLLKMASRAADTQDV